MPWRPRGCWRPSRQDATRRRSERLSDERSSTPVAIEARGWGWRHAGRRRWALRGVDLRIEAGERVLLLGPSGSGKSTLLLGLAGLLEAGESEGELLLDAGDARSVRQRAGILFQDPGTQLVMSRAGDDVAFGPENRCVPPDQIWPRVQGALDAVGFRYSLEHPVDALSGGEQQRLALAGVLALEPGLLLLDEPTANLDPGGAQLVRDALSRLSNHSPITTLLVEHRLDEAIPLVDRAIVLQAGGGVIADGPAEAIFRERGDDLAAAGVWVPGRPLPESHADRAPGATAIVAAGLGYRYPGARANAVEGVDLELRSGEALAVTGANGSGKSTLALLLGGLLRPSAGQVTAAGSPPTRSAEFPIHRWPAGRLAAHIGSVFQDPEHQFLTGSVMDELTLGPMRGGHSRAAAESLAEELMARLHLTPLAAANPFSLSGGEKRRLSVATAIATRPAVLILDEPTFGQDRHTALELLDLLAALRGEGSAICMASHDAGFVAALADRQVRLEEGHLR